MVNITNLRTLKSIKMDYDGPYLIKDIDWGTIDLKLTTNTYYKQIGDNIIGRKWGTRTIKIIGNVISDEAMTVDDRKGYLNELFNLNDDVRVQYDGVYIVGALRSTVSFGNSYSDNNDQFCKFYIELYCSDPLFKSATLYRVDLSNWQNNLEFPLEVPLDNTVDAGLKYPTGTEFEIMVQNTAKQFNVVGHLEIPFTLELQIRGDVVNPSFTHIAKNQFIKLNYTLYNEDKVIISTDSRASKPITLIRNNTETNIFKYRDKQSTLDMRFDIGVNYVVLGADSGETFLGGTISYESLFTGVKWTC